VAAARHALPPRRATAFHNELAAVPSLHAGFALAVSVTIVAAAGGRWAKVIGALWAPAIALAVVATGNHFLFDILAGFAVTAVGYALGRLVRERRLGVRAPRPLPVLRPATE
jgi:membrane-associated phospholipid phosphatase